MARIVFVVLALAHVSFANVMAPAPPQENLEPGEVAAGAAPGIVNGVMNGFFQSAFPSFGNFGSGNAQPFGFFGGNSGLAFQPHAGTPEPSASTEKPVHQYGNIMQGFPSFLGKFGNPMYKAPAVYQSTEAPASTVAGSTSETEAAPSWDFFSNQKNQKFQVPGLSALGGPTTNMKCYMGSSSQQGQSQNCNVEKQSRFYFDMLKKECNAVESCPRYQNGGWSQSSEGGFATEEECLQACKPEPKHGSEEEEHSHEHDDEDDINMNDHKDLGKYFGNLGLPASFLGYPGPAAANKPNFFAAGPVGLLDVVSSTPHAPTQTPGFLL